MRTTAEIKEKLEKVFDKRQATILSEIIFVAYSDLVKASDFNELKAIVKELAEAQKRSEQRLARLETVVERLVEAQKRSEQRLTRLETVVEGLAEAQERSEQRLTRLETVVERLVEAQERSEQRLTRLEIVVEGLAEAQKRTEEELRELVQEHKKTRSQVGGLSMTVGYRLEDEAHKALPELLKRDFGIVVEGRIKRQYVTDNKGKEIEVNIIGKASRNGKKLVIAGEGKSQLSKNDVDQFVRKKLKRLEGVFEEIFPILITYMITEPDVEAYAKEKGIVLYYSYDL